MLKQTVRVFRGKKSTVLGGHVVRDVIQNVARDVGELSILRDLKCVEIRGRKLRLIVKHFFEMRYMPVTIDRVTMKSAAEMIVHSARRHFTEREQIHLQCVL